MVLFDVNMDKFSRGRLKDKYDIVVVGGGPAGLSAALYARRSGLSVVVIEKLSEGGQILLTDVIENYPGFGKIKGSELSKKLKEHAEMFGAEFVFDEVTKIENPSSKWKKIVLMDGKIISTKVVIIATGASPKRLNVPGEAEFRSKGVSYCAVCDGHLFSGKHVAVIGGGDTAIEEALFLSNIVSKVTVIHRRNKLRAVKYLQDRAFENEKIEFVWDSVVKEMKGDEKLRYIVLENVRTGELTEYPVDAVFVSIGLKPESDLVKDIVDTDENGFIFTDENMETKTEGIFAVGDVRVKPLRQVITAVSDGAIAATIAARKYFE